MKLAISTILLAALRASSAAESNGHSCACEAEEFGFEIDCSNPQPQLDSLAILQSSGCANDCSSPECEKHYLLVQSHHDYCPEDVIPQEVEDGFHDYDLTCLACDINRIAKEGAVDCPTPNCEDGSGNGAYGALVDSGCQSDCASDSCRTNYFTLKTVHDLCDHDALSRASEEGLHDMEDACEALHQCNVAGVSDSQLVCDDHDHEDHEDHDDHGDEDHDDHDDEEVKTSGAAKLSSFGAAFAAFLANWII